MFRTPTSEELRRVRSKLAELHFASPGNSNVQGVPYQEVYFAELSETASRRSGSRARVDAILRNADVAGKLIIDLGCNLGYFCFALAERGARTVGIDYDRDSITGASLLKELYQADTTSFVQAALKRESLEDIVRQHGEPDIILLNSVVHWLFHAHDTLDGVMRALEPLFSTTKRQTIFYEPSSTGAAYFPELLRPENIQRFFISCGATEWRLVGRFPASNARQRREYYIATRDYQELLQMAAAAVTDEHSCPERAGVMLERTRKNGKVRCLTQRIFVKSHEPHDSLARKLLQQEERMVRLLGGAPGPFLIASGDVDGRFVLVFRAEDARSIRSSFIRTRDIPALDLQLILMLKRLCEHSISHNDITPDNLLWDPSAGRLVLVDFEFSTVVKDGPVSLADYFTALSPEHAERVSSLVNELGGKWRLEAGIGSLHHDRFAAKSVLYFVKDRGRYRVQRIKASLLRAGVALYRRVIPQAFRKEPTVTPYL